MNDKDNERQRVLESIIHNFIKNSAIACLVSSVFLGITSNILWIANNPDCSIWGETAAFSFGLFSVFCIIRAAVEGIDPE